MRNRKSRMWLTIFVVLTVFPFTAIAVEWKGQEWRVNLNGSLRVSYNDDKIGTSCSKDNTCDLPSGTPDGKSNRYLSGNVSNIQLSGERMLRLGTKGIFKTEWGLDPTNSPEEATLFDLEQFLGLGGGFGMLRAGTINTPYMQTGIDMDPFQNDSLAARFFPEIQSGLHSLVGKGRGRATNALRYDSPISAQGLSAQMFMGFDESPDNDNSFGTGFSFRSEKISLFIQWYDNGESGKDEAYKVGGELKGGGVSLFGQYEFDQGLISLADNLSPVSDPTSSDITAEGNHTHGADTWHAGLNYMSGKFLFMGQYGERKNSKNGTSEEDGLAGWLVGLSLYLDKTFYIYTGYLQKDFNDGSDSDSRFTIGATLTF